MNEYYAPPTALASPNPVLAAIAQLIWEARLRSIGLWYVQRDGVLWLVPVN